MPVKQKKNSCPINDAVEALDKQQENFMKILEKESTYCKKTMDSLKKKKLKLSETKSKAVKKKAAIALKVKSKPTTTNKTQAQNAKKTVIKASADLNTISDELAAMKVITDRMTSLLKERKAEAALVKKLRASQAKAAAKKPVKKKKPKAKTNNTKK